MSTSSGHEAPMILADDRNHGSRSPLTAMLLVHHLPEPVVALRPAALCSPLRQWFRSALCSGLAFQHFEVVFEIEDLLRAFITAFVLRDPNAVLPELNHAGVNTSFDHGA